MQKLRLRQRSPILHMLLVMLSRISRKPPEAADPIV